MGEAAEMILDGTVCEGCGEAFDPDDESPGYPRRCVGCEPITIQRAAPRHQRRRNGRSRRAAAKARGEAS